MELLFNVRGGLKLLRQSSVQRYFCINFEILYKTQSPCRFWSCLEGKYCEDIILVMFSVLTCSELAHDRKHSNYYLSLFFLANAPFFLGKPSSLILIVFDQLCDHVREKKNSKVRWSASSFIFCCLTYCSFFWNVLTVFREMNFLLQIFVMHVKTCWLLKFKINSFVIVDDLFNFLIGNNFISLIRGNYKNG